MIPSVHKEDMRYGKYELVIINGRKCVKKDFEYKNSANFMKSVQSKDLRKQFDPAFFSELIDFESGKYDSSSRRRGSRRSSRSGSRSSRGSSRSSSRSGSQTKSTRRVYTGDSKVKPNFWLTW